MTNLEPDVFLGQWTWRVVDDVLETLPKRENGLAHAAEGDTYVETLIELLLLLVDYA